jgi:hypothetical protein
VTLLGHNFRQPGCHTECERPRVRRLSRHDADVLDGDAAQQSELEHERIDQPCRGQHDSELVDGATTTTLEDVDADHVTSDSTDLRGQLTEHSRPVGQPEAHQAHNCLP